MRNIKLKWRKLIIEIEEISSWFLLGVLLLAGILLVIGGAHTFLR